MEGRGKSQNHAKEERLHVSENGEGGLESEASGSLENCPPQAKEVAVWMCVCVRGRDFEWCVVQGGWLRIPFPIRNCQILVNGCTLTPCVVSIVKTDACTQVLQN